MPFSTTSIETFITEFTTAFLIAPLWTALIANGSKNREALTKHIQGQMMKLGEAVRPNIRVFTPRGD